MIAHDYSGNSFRCRRCGVTRPEGVHVGCQEPRHDTANLVVPASDLKMLRETLAAAQGALISTNWQRPYMDRLQFLIDQIDRHRPLGPDGTHGDRHTSTCGCDLPPPAEAEFPTGLPSEPEVGRITVTFYGGPYNGIRANLVRTPPRVEIRGVLYERVDDPDTGIFLGLYVHDAPTEGTF